MSYTLEGLHLIIISHLSLSLSLPHLLLSFPDSVFCTVVSLSVPSRRNCRRGSIQNHTSQQCYKDLLKGSILQRVGAEEQARLIQVNRIIFPCTILVKHSFCAHFYYMWTLLCVYFVIHSHLYIQCIYMYMHLAMM